MPVTIPLSEMTMMRILVDAEGKLPELQNKQITQVKPADQIWTALPGGMASGKASVAVFAKLPDDSYVMAQQSMRNFVMVAVAFAAKYPDEWREMGVTLEVTPHPKGAQ